MQLGLSEGLIVSPESGLTHETYGLSSPDRKEELSIRIDFQNLASGAPIQPQNVQSRKLQFSATTGHMAFSAARVVHSSDPPNAEPLPDVVGASFITPTEQFYTRCHLPMPDVDVSDYKVAVEGVDLRYVEFSLDNIRALEKRTLVATLQCAGNRRLEMDRFRSVKGDPWDIGAIGTAKFTGARLLDVLQLAGLDTSKQPNFAHIHFIGLDAKDGTHYEASIPANLALKEDSNVLLIYEMNNRPLTKEHGYPLRVVAPGIVGARCVKWLSRIVTSREENDSQWQKRDYKVFSPDVINYDDVDWNSMPAIQELNVHSAICKPTSGAVVKRGTRSITVSGYAYSGGGRRVCRVDLSANGGKTWTKASLLPKEGSSSERDWSWTLWQLQLPVPEEAETLELCCKAVDDSHNTQPAEVQHIWNIRGVLNNAFHRVVVRVQ